MTPRRDINEANIVRQGLASMGLEDGATEGQVPAIGADGEVEFVDQSGVGGTSAGAAIWTGPIICRAAEFQTLEVTGASSGTFTLSDLNFSTAWGDIEGLWVGLDECIVPSVPNGHAYRAIVAGLSDPNTEPIWPTDGGTVEDFAVTWQDLGEVPVTTAAIPFDASAAQVQAALDAIAPDKFACSGGPLNSEVVEIEAAPAVPLVLLAVDDSTNGAATCVVTTTRVNNDDNSRRYALAALEAGMILEDVLVQRTIPFDDGLLTFTSPVAVFGFEPGPEPPTGGDDWYQPKGPFMSPQDREWHGYMTGIEGGDSTRASSAFGAVLRSPGASVKLPAVAKRPHTVYALFIDMAAATVGEVRVWIKTATPVAPS